MGNRIEQRVLSATLREQGKPWVEVVAEFRMRWGLNARQTLRHARGLIQREVAAEWTKRWPDDPRTDESVGTWERWPHGGHAPTLVILDRLAQIYRCSVADLVSDFPDHSTNVQFAGQDGNVDRRQLMVGIGTSLVASGMPTIPQVSAATSGTRVAPEAADFFRQQLDSHSQADVYLGPHMVITGVRAHYQALTNAIAGSKGELHGELLRIATGYAALAGWLYLDAGDLVSSAGWRAEALELAHRAGDLQLISYALTGQAVFRVEVGDGVGAVDLAEANLANAPNLAPKPRVLALAQLAHGRSLLGDRAGVDRALDDMASLIDRVDDDWHWGNFCRAPKHVDGARATCYGRLGLASEAADLWTGTIRRQPASARRDVGVYQARHASVMLDAGEPGEATRFARRSLDALHDTGSVRMRLELARLADKAKGWRNSADGRELAGVLSAIN